MTAGSLNPNAGDLGRARRILGYLLRHRAMFGAGLVVTMLFGASETLVPWVMYLLLEPEGATWLPAGSMPVALPLLLIGLFVVRGVLGFARTYWREWLQQTMARDLRRELAARLVRLPKSYHDREASGVLLSRMTQFIDQMLQSSVGFLVTLIQDLARLTGYLATMFYVEWRFTLVALVAIPVTLVVIGWIARRIRLHSGRQVTALGKLTGRFGDVIQGQVVVKTFGGQQREYQRLAADLERVRGIGLRQAVAKALNLPLSQLFVALALALILGLLAAALGDGSMSTGEVGTFLFAMVLLPLTLRNLATVVEQAQSSLAASAQVFHLLDSPPEEPGGTHAPAAIRGDVEFRDVRFAYPAGDGPPALAGVDLMLAAGEKVALVGPSGGGKSTLANLLLGFYHPTAGHVAVDGVPVGDWSLDALRAGIGIVTQDVVLFDTTIAENIAYPHTGDQIDAPRLAGAIDAAQAANLVKSLPDGVATVIGERGMHLSGGERQRLAIARAFYKDAPILVLDEATSALDAQTEAALQEALRRLLAGRTALIIAHRMATVDLADRIAVVDGGQVTATGTHAELLAASPLYRRLREFQHTTATPE